LADFEIRAWTRPHASGHWDAFAISYPAGTTRRVAVDRMERPAATEADARAAAVSLAGVIAEKVRRRGDEVSSLRVLERPPDEFP
jgi:hypothetical protein